MYTPHLGNSTVILQFNLFAVLAPRKPHLRSDTSQPRTPSVSDPERILHRRNWRGRPFVHTEIPPLSLEDLPSSSSQVAQWQDSNSALGEAGYYSDYLPTGNIRVKDEVELVDTTRYIFHPTPEIEEVKEVTEVSTVTTPPLSPSSQTAVHYIPIIIHTVLPPVVHISSSI